MSNMRVEDTFTIGGCKTVVTGISNGTFSICEDLYLVVEDGVIPASLQGIEIDRQTLEYCDEGDAVGFLLETESPIDLEIYKKFVPELDYGYFQVYITNDATEIDSLNQALIQPDELVTTIQELVEEQFKLFSDVLMRKFKQLTYIDEYDEFELGNFPKEVSNFISKKLNYEGGILTYSTDYLINIIMQNALDQTQSNDIEMTDDPYEYEDMCGQLLGNNGWKVIPTPKSGDQGADVIAERDGLRIVLQCKLYSQPVGNKAVQEVYSAREYYGAALAYVVSNATYTKSAKLLANSLGVELIHHDQLHYL